MSGEQMQVVEVRKIRTRDGSVLEVSLTQKFIDVLRQHFGLLESQPVEDDHVRMYVFGAVNTAVNRAEKELSDVKPGDPAG
jgi:hypothetical protein